MTIETKPQPDSTDTSPASGEAIESADVTTTQPNLEQEEEEAARLGDFA